MEAEAEIVIASSPADAGVSCWDIKTGSERLRYKTCVSPSHGLVSVGGGGFIASSQIRERKSSSSGSIFYWSWNKSQVEVKSFQSEPIGPLVSDSQGTFIVGGGVSGDIYLWEVVSGKLLKKWHAHYRAVTCLVLNDDESLLISGAEDGYVRVWSLYLMFDDARREKTTHPYEHSFIEHTLKVTDVKCCFSGPNAFIVSASEDHTCKIWRLSTGELIQNVIFPSAVNAISVDPWKGILYAGAGDGKIYISALNSPSSANGNYGKRIISTFSEQRKAVTCLASNSDGSLLVSGSEDGLVIIWDTRTCNFVHSLRHTKGPVNNVQVIRQKEYVNPGKSASLTLRRHGSTLPPPLEKFIISPEENVCIKAVVNPLAISRSPEPVYYSVQFMDKRINDLQRRDPALEPDRVEIEKLRSDLQRSNQVIQQWKKMNENLHQLCVNQLINSTHN